jgi:hypothetical protein
MVKVRRSLWICVSRLSLVTRDMSEAEPLDLRYQAEPGNEGNDKIIT